MSERHFDSEPELRDFVADIADEYCADAAEWGTYEAATALYEDHGLDP
jgi:hypothetical protein